MIYSWIATSSYNTALQRMLYFVLAKTIGERKILSIIKFCELLNPILHYRIALTARIIPAASMPIIANNSSGFPERGNCVTARH
jgi:hypothetical protein